MPTSSNSIQSEIDAIIARAMAEYSAARGIAPDPFADLADAIVADVTQTTQEVEEDNTPDEIPANSSSLLVEEQTSRFNSALWFDTVQSKTVTLAGLGGIGSYISFLLARLHVAGLILYDDDIVEAGNMSGQLYESKHIGRNKADSCADVVERFSNYYNITAMDERFTANSTPTDIMICGFDNMEARKVFYNRWKQWLGNYDEVERQKCLFIDGRLAAENLQILCIRGDDTVSMARYEKDFLFSDAEADETVCSYKQTSFIANMIGSLIVNLFVNFCANQCNPLVPRDLPFYTEYNAETFYFKVIN